MTEVEIKNWHPYAIVVRAPFLSADVLPPVFCFVFDILFVTVPCLFVCYIPPSSTLANFFFVWTDECDGDDEGFVASPVNLLSSLIYVYCMMYSRRLLANCHDLALFLPSFFR